MPFIERKLPRRKSNFILGKTWHLAPICVTPQGKQKMTYQAILRLYSIFSILCWKKDAHIFGFWIFLVMWAHFPTYKMLNWPENEVIFPMLKFQSVINFRADQLLSLRVQPNGHIHIYFFQKSMLTYIAVSQRVKSSASVTRNSSCTFLITVFYFTYYKLNLYYCQSTIVILSMWDNLMKDVDGFFSITCHWEKQPP